MRLPARRSIPTAKILTVGLAMAFTLALAFVAYSPALAKESATPTPAAAQDASRTASAETLEAEPVCSEPGYECLPDGSIQIEYYDPTGVCTWTMQVDWGDGSPTESKTLPQGGSVTASHTYTEPGLYTIDINFPPGTSSDPENQECLALHDTRNVEVPGPDPDADGDGVNDDVDNCPSDANPGQEDADGDGQGDACEDPDADGDGHPDNNDNCFLDHNPGQEDADGDGQGDACDNDADNDGDPDNADNCPAASNPSQADTDGDGQGDACDPYTSLDTDKDGTSDSADNCMARSNPDQADGDADGIGDACDDTVGTGGDTTYQSTRYVNSFVRTVSGPPIIQATQAQDTFPDGKVSRADLIVIQFNETMHASTAEEGASFRVRDADGTVAVITCGPKASCDLNKGRAIGLPGTTTLKDKQGLAVILLASPDEVNPGTVSGLQYPATITRVNDKFKDRSGQQLDLNGSRDRRIEIGPIS